MFFHHVPWQTPGHTPAHTPSNSRWDETPGRPKGSETPGATPSTRMWDPTPSHTPAGAATPGRDTPGHATPGHGGATGSVRKNRWDETPKTERETPGHGSGWAETPRTDRGDESVGETPTPGASKRKSRWDETPASQMGSSTPLLTPGKTPIGTPAMNMATPTPGRQPPHVNVTLLLCSAHLTEWGCWCECFVPFCFVRSSD